MAVYSPAIGANGNISMTGSIKEKIARQIGFQRYSAALTITVACLTVTCLHISVSMSPPEKLYILLYSGGQLFVIDNVQNVRHMSELHYVRSGRNIISIMMSVIVFMLWV